MIKEITKLAVRASDRLGYYVVKRDWYVKVDGREFKVPAGFEFDGDSVPRLPIIYWLTKNRVGLKAPALHDWLYHSQVVSRKEADRLYLRLMDETGVKLVWKWAHYFGVRIGGWWAWWNHRRRRAEASKR